MTNKQTPFTTQLKTTKVDGFLFQSKSYQELLRKIDPARFLFPGLPMIETPSLTASLLRTAVKHYNNIDLALGRIRGWQHRRTDRAKCSCGTREFVQQAAAQLSGQAMLQ
jgi:hypothetical protein